MKYPPIRIYILSLLISFFFSWLQEKDASLKEVVTTYYEDGAIRLQLEVIDSVPNGYWKEFYPNGQLKKSSFMKNGILEGSAKEFYPTGQLRASFRFKNNKKEGEEIGYYENGNIQSIGFYNKGIPHGWSKDYFEENSGKIHGLFKSVSVHDKPILMERIVFDSLGEKIVEEKVLDIKSNSDTIRVGEELKLSVQLLRPEFDHTRVTIGEYDDLFYLLDSSSVDTFPAPNHIAHIKVKAEKLGDNVVRGRLDNFIIEEKTDTSESILSSVKFFDFPYFVVP